MTIGKEEQTGTPKKIELTPEQRAEAKVKKNKILKKINELDEKFYQNNMEFKRLIELLTQKKKVLEEKSEDKRNALWKHNWTVVNRQIATLNEGKNDLCKKLEKHDSDVASSLVSYKMNVNHRALNTEYHNELTLEEKAAEGLKSFTKIIKSTPKKLINLREALPLILENEERINTMYENLYAYLKKYGKELTTFEACIDNIHIQLEPEKLLEKVRARQKSIYPDDCQVTFNPLKHYLDGASLFSKSKVKGKENADQPKSPGPN